MTTKDASNGGFTPTIGGSGEFTTTADETGGLTTTGENLEGSTTPILPVQSGGTFFLATPGPIPIEIIPCGVQTIEINPVDNEEETKIQAVDVNNTGIETVEIPSFSNYVVDMSFDCIF